MPHGTSYISERFRLLHKGLQERGLPTEPMRTASCASSRMRRRAHCSSLAASPAYKRTSHQTAPEPTATKARVTEAVAVRRRTCASEPLVYHGGTHWASLESRGGRWTADS
jgi:hypothetical protein